jgi:hypothetical protein
MSQPFPRVANVPRVCERHACTVSFFSASSLSLSAWASSR